MLLILFCLVFNVIDGIPIAKMHDSDLMSQIMSSRDNNEVLLNVLADADPVQLNRVITLLKGLLATSRTELEGLVTSSSAADTAFTNAENAHNAALVAQTNGLETLRTTRDTAIARANSTYDQEVAALQDVVDLAKGLVDTTNSSKTTANALLAADRTRLDSEISTLTQVISLMESVLGINTVSPTMAPTFSPTASVGASEAGVIINSPQSSRTYSSVWDNNGCVRSMIDANGAWCARQASEGEWMQIDMGSVRTDIIGVQTQGRYGMDQIVTSFQVMSSDDGTVFSPVDGGKIFFNTEEHISNFANNPKKDNLFSGSISARYIRFIVKTWHSFPSMRADVLITNSCQWLEEKTSTCNHNRDMLCNNQNNQDCTLDYCKSQAINLSYKYFTYGPEHWCIMCNTDANGLMIDVGDVNTAYTLYTHDCSA